MQIAYIFVILWICCNDIKYGIVSTTSLLFLFLLQLPYTEYYISALVFYIFILLFNNLWLYVRGYYPCGGGDEKLTAIFFMTCSLNQAQVMISIASGALLCKYALDFLRKVKKEEKFIPFAPYLCLGWICSRFI